MAAYQNSPVSVGDGSSKIHQHVCPICGQGTDTDGRYFPFCSDRCKTTDLGNWASERYRISRPIEQSDIEEGE